MTDAVVTFVRRGRGPAPESAPVRVWLEESDDEVNWAVCDGGGPWDIDANTTVEFHVAPAPRRRHVRPRAECDAAVTFLVDVRIREWRN